MSRFPSPIAIPQEVQIERKHRLHQLIKSCFLGLFLRIMIIGAELLGVYFSGSSALLMDALTSTVDVFSTILLIFSIRFAARPPDMNHPFGHGRAEPLIGLQLGLFMAVVGGGMLIKESLDLGGETPEFTIDPRLWIIPFFAAISLEVCYHYVKSVAKKQHSPALAADAAHYRIDSLTSVFATIALLSAAYAPAWGYVFDHIGAIAIAIFMIVIGLNASKANVKQLLDTKPEEEFFAKVEKAARRVQGVKGTEKIRIQQYGPDAHVDIDIEVDPNLSVQLAHKISQKVRVEIQKDWAAVRDVTVHIEPFYPGDH